eukprot:jgi/Mesvir1/27963/Mv20170-RA.2
MTRMSKIFMVAVNTITLLAGLLLIAIGIWMFVGGSGMGAGCREWLQYPILIPGIVIFAVSLIGYAAAVRPYRVLIAFYFILIVMLIMIALAFAIFMFVVTRPNGAQWIENAGFTEYSIGNYSSWLQDQVNDKDNWREISNCLKSAIDCPVLPPSKGGTTNRIKRYCCFAPAGGTFASIIRDEWGTVAIVTIVAVALMVLTLMAACCLRRRGFNNGGYPKGATPTAGNATPKAGLTPTYGYSTKYGYTPNAGSATPPKAESTTPNDEYAAPRFESTPPRGGSTTPRGGSTTPRGGSTTPRGGSTTPPRGGSTTPRSTTPPRGGSTTPRGGSTTPRGGSTTPRGGSTTPPRGGSTAPLSPGALAMHRVPR